MSDYSYGSLEQISVQNEAIRGAHASIFSSFNAITAEYATLLKVDDFCGWHGKSAGLFQKKVNALNENITTVMDDLATSNYNLGVILLTYAGVEQTNQTTGSGLPTDIFG